MFYQLPNGKVLYLSVEEYLSLTDEELHQLSNSGHGEYMSPNASFTGRKQKSNIIDDDLDYKPDDDETDTRGPINLDNLE